MNGFGCGWVSPWRSSGRCTTVAVIKWVLPWFRGGADVHFASYFSDLGGSSGEIIANIVAKPWLFVGKVLSPGTGLFAAALLLPLGGLSLLSPSRFFVALPLLLVLGLNQISRSPYITSTPPWFPCCCGAPPPAWGPFFKGGTGPAIFHGRCSHAPLDPELHMRTWPVAAFPPKPFAPRGNRCQPPHPNRTGRHAQHQRGLPAT